jgi:hypothetical protein
VASLNILFYDVFILPILTCHALVDYNSCDCGLNKHVVFIINWLRLIKVIITFIYYTC